MKVARRPVVVDGVLSAPVGEVDHPEVGLIDDHEQMDALLRVLGFLDVDEEGNNRYVRESDGVRAVLTVNRDHKPLRVDVADPEMRFRVTYDTYEWLAPKPELFEKPKGIAFEEAKPEK